VQLPRQDEKHPIIAGLIALVSVTLVVGLVLGIVAAVSVHVFGVGGGDNNSASAGQTMYLPTPSPTPTPSGPLVTLAPSTDSPSTTPGEEPSDSAKAKPSKSPSAPAKQITLSAGETSVAPMEQIDLTGVYPGGEGAILQVQRKLGGTWQDFLSVDAAVSGGQFSTYVQTGQIGVQKFRMRDTTSGMLSNVVSVKVG
jgi:hypothetical protein